MEDTPSDVAWQKKLNSMSEAELRRYCNDTAQRHEQKLVRDEVACGNLAWRIAKEFDVIVIDKHGTTWVVDCKAALTSHTFCIENSDIVKLYAVGQDIAKRQNREVKMRFNMWFPHTRQKNNCRYIDITKEDVAWSIRCTKTRQQITTKRVAPGKCEERE